MRDGIVSDKSFTFYLKNPTAQKQSLNLFKLGSKDNPTIKKDAFFQDGSSAGILDLSLIIEKVLLDNDGDNIYILKNGSEIDLQIFDVGADVNINYNYVVNGTTTRWLDVLNSLNLQSNVFNQFGFLTEFEVNGYWATNTTRQFANHFRVTFGENMNELGTNNAAIPIGAYPVRMPNLSSAMVQIEGKDYAEQNLSQIGSPIGADPFQPLLEGGNGGGVRNAPTKNLEINTISSNPLQLQECIIFNRLDTNGNAIGTAECPTIDPYQKQNINGIDTSNVIFDGNTKMSYGVLANTTAIQTYNYSQSYESMIDSKNALNFEIGRDLVDAIMVKEEKEEMVNFDGKKESNGFIVSAVVLIMGFLILRNK